MGLDACILVMSNTIVTFLAIHSTQCILSFMSIFIVDYMTLFPKVKEMFNGLELPMQFAIGMYEDAMRGENKYR